MSSRRDKRDHPAELSSVCGSNQQPAYIGKASREGAGRWKECVPPTIKKQAETPERGQSTEPTLQAALCSLRLSSQLLHFKLFQLKGKIHLCSNCYS